MAISSFGMPMSISAAFSFSKVALDSLPLGWAWNSTMGRIYCPPLASAALACRSILPRSWIASVRTSCLVCRLYTITGSLTMFSRFISRASTMEMILLFCRGVAVRSSTNDGLRFFSISTLSSLVALWLSSTTTTGFICPST